MVVGPCMHSNCFPLIGVVRTRALVRTLEYSFSQCFSSPNNHLSKMVTNLVVGPYKGPARFSTFHPLIGVIRTLESIFSQLISPFKNHLPKVAVNMVVGHQHL